MNDELEQRLGDGLNFLFGDVLTEAESIGPPAGRHSGAVRSGLPTGSSGRTCGGSSTIRAERPTASGRLRSRACGSGEPRPHQARLLLDRALNPTSIVLAGPELAWALRRRLARRLGLDALFLLRSEGGGVRAAGTGPLFSKVPVAKPAEVAPVKAAGDA
jgi:hypothetical protein